MKAGKIKYSMSYEFAQNILKNRKGDEKKKNAQVVLCDYVNSQCGLLGECVEVIIDIK